MFGSANVSTGKPKCWYPRLLVEGYTARTKNSNRSAAAL